MKKLLTILTILSLSIPLGAFAGPTTFTSSVVPISSNTYYLGTSSPSLLQYLGLFTKSATISDLSGAGTKCVQTDNNGLLAVAAAACGSGGGGGSGSGTFATSTAFGTTYLNYPLNATDVVMIGSVGATSTAKFFFDPNISLAKIAANFWVTGSTTLNTLTFFNATGTSATSTNFFATNASTTNFYGTNINGFNLTTCNGTTNALSWSGGIFGCGTIAPPASAITSTGDLTKVDDTNVTLTLGGTPTGSLLKATSLTLGWTGTLADSRVADNLTISGGTVDNSVIGGTTKAAGSFTNILASSSTTLQNLTFVNATGTSATTTNLAVSSLASAVVITNGSGTMANYAGTSCTNQFVRSLSGLAAATCATVGAADVSLANLTATDATLTFSGTYTGATARTIGLNLGNANTWTALQTFSNANAILATGSTTLQSFTATTATATAATTTNFFSTTFNAVTASTSVLTTQTLLALSSTTLQNFTATNSTTTNATSTVHYVSGTVAIATTTPWINASGGLAIGAPAGILPLFSIGSSTSNGGTGLVASIAYQPYAATAFGTSTPDAEFAFQASTSATTLWPNILDIASSTSGTAVTSLFRISQGGAVFIPKATQSAGAQTYVACGAATTFEFIWDTLTCATSAAKYKTNIANLDIGLKELLKVRPVVYNWKPTGNLEYDLDRNINHQQIGLIADEVEKIDSRLVTYDKNGEIHGFNYENYTAWLTKAIQELNDKTQTTQKGADWQWLAIGLLVLGMGYQQWQISKLRQ